MKVLLSPCWELSTEYASSSDGQPMLVSRSTGEAYGPGDDVRPSQFTGYATAAEVVRRLAKTVKLDAEGWALVDRFAGFRSATPTRAVDRSGCREPTCPCHDDAAWVPGVTYRDGCSACGCRWADAALR